MEKMACVTLLCFLFWKILLKNWSNKRIWDQSCTRPYKKNIYNHTCINNIIIIFDFFLNIVRESAPMQRDTGTEWCVHLSFGLNTTLPHAQSVTLLTYTVTPPLRLPSGSWQSGVISSSQLLLWRTIGWTGSCWGLCQHFLLYHFRASGNPQGQNIWLFKNSGIWPPPQWINTDYDSFPKTSKHS